MADDASEPRTGGRRLPSIFDGLPPGPVDLAALEARMARDTQARTLAALDRALATGADRTAGDTPRRPAVGGQP